MRKLDVVRGRWKEFVDAGGEKEEEEEITRC
jgi:hypothetical protein